MNIYRKPLLICLLILALPGLGLAQISFTVDTLAFPPTTIDSTSTIEVTLTNTLSVPQEVTFNVTDSPFYMSDNPLTVPGEGSASTTMSFIPTSVNTFPIELIASGSVFGADTISLVAEGTLPGAELILDTLDFGTKSVNNIATMFLPIASTGIGTLFIDSISSSDPVFYAEGGISIPQGDTSQVAVNFYSELSGVYEVDLTVFTSDPFNPTLNLHCSVTAISAVSGEVCGTWSLINSPYQLIDNIVVPEGCTLNVEAGVIIQGGEFDIEVHGGFISNGTSESHVTISLGEFISHSPSENVVLNFTDLTETNEFEFIDRDYRDFKELNPLSGDLAYWLDTLSMVDEVFLINQTNLFENENSENHIGKYSENFNDNMGQGWGGGTSGPSNYEVYYNGSSNSYYTVQLTSPVFIANVGENFENVSFSTQMDYWTTYDRYMRYYVRYDGGAWNQIGQDYYNNDGQWYQNEFALTPSEGAETVQFKTDYYFRYYSYCRIDDFVLTTSLYPGEDIPLIEITSPSVISVIDYYDFLSYSLLTQQDSWIDNAYEISYEAKSISTGGIELYNSTFTGDFHSVNDTLNVVLENSQLLGSEEREKDSHGLGLYADHVNLTITNTTISGHALDGVYVLTDDLILNTENSNVENNGTQGYQVEGDLLWNSNQDTITENGFDGMHLIGNLDWISQNDVVSGNGGDGLDISGDVTWTSYVDEVNNNGGTGIDITGTLTLEADSSEWMGNSGDGVVATGSNSSLILYQTRNNDNSGDGYRLTGSNSHLEADYSFVRDNGGDAIKMGYSGTCRLDNCLLGYNGGDGIVTGGAVVLNYCNIIHNGGYGISTSQFSTVDNSIIWFNGGVPQMVTNNVYAVSYTNVQGINALQTSIDFAWGDGCIGTDPALADDNGHLDPYSPCVDGGMPWEQDAHIPYGLGSSRADMGMYGGPANEYWGGQAPPNGSVSITDMFDIPGDQGGYVGIHFSASPFDFGGLGFNVTHYSIWRDLDLGGDVVNSVEEGNWEQIGTVPAQGFPQYGYTAATLINTYPGETACLSNFIVIAHTTDDNIYWVSDVEGACSEDNLSPNPPEFMGMPVEGGDGEMVAQLVWAEPEEEDYAYTVITSLSGFEVTVTGDTITIDDSVLPGNVYTYEAVHFDIHGNASSIATATVEIIGQGDLIPLTEGWNLISTDRIPEDADMDVVFGGLIPGNLNYVIGFQGGVTYYDPEGLAFLNTLGSLDPGFGYWVKVGAADTLVVGGIPISDTFMPGLDMGWNLIGYAPQEGVQPEAYFSEMIGDGNLLYVTGFDEGVLVYDPNGLPFLQTLIEMQNGFGYWVKTVNGTEGEVLMPEQENTLKGLSPAFEIFYGRCDLAEGSVVEIFADGDVIGEIAVSSEGYLMTSVIYGDDPLTPQTEGVLPGVEIRFGYLGAKSDQKVVFAGDMSRNILVLRFEHSEFQIYPNPVSDITTCSFSTHEESAVRVIIKDAIGREVLEVFDGVLSEGNHEYKISTIHLESGTFVISLFVDGKEISSKKVVKTSR